MNERKKLTEFVSGHGFEKTDWDAVSDNPEWTEQDIRHAKPFAEVFPDLATQLKRGRGRPPMDDPKRQVTLRIDQAVIDRFKANGPGWQRRINEALRRAVGLDEKST
jgi:uncharacterized protein (DUF4415 family)